MVAENFEFLQWHQHFTKALCSFIRVRHDYPFLFIFSVFGVVPRLYTSGLKGIKSIIYKDAEDEDERTIKAGWRTAGIGVVVSAIENIGKSNQIRGVGWSKSGLKDIPLHIVHPTLHLHMDPFNVH